MGSGQGKTAADLALEELGAFDSRDEEEGIDPDAPAAMKASPSGSDDSGVHLCRGWVWQWRGIAWRGCNGVWVCARGVE